MMVREDPDIATTRRISSSLMTIAVSADLLSRFLAGEGYRVTTAKDALDARAKLAGLEL